LLNFSIYTYTKDNQWSAC